MPGTCFAGFTKRDCARGPAPVQPRSGREPERRARSRHRRRTRLAGFVEWVPLRTAPDLRFAVRWAGCGAQRPGPTDLGHFEVMTARSERHRFEREFKNARFAGRAEPCYRDWSLCKQTSTGFFRSRVDCSRPMVSAGEAGSRPAKVTKCRAGVELSIPTPPAPAPGATMCRTAVSGVIKLKASCSSLYFIPQRVFATFTCARTPSASRPTRPDWPSEKSHFPGVGPSAATCLGLSKYQ